ncbi:MAG: sigma-70 family RNA polymerase sigma factor [Desulfobacteraceae bacterium]|nr:sigma-70 family RNA polymerase sigma factor [Desulfobacteraceae bacterium]
MGHESDDAQLIDRFKKGETPVFERLVIKYQDRIYNLCRHMLGNAHDAEDAAQDTFIKAYRGLHGFKPEASFYTWLYRIAVNTCLDYKKRPFLRSVLKIHNEPDEPAPEPASDESSPEKLYESKQLMLTLHKALGMLPLKLQAAILLREVEGLSYSEMAEMLGISVGTVKSRISRGREELKKLMKKIGEQK